MTSSLLGLAHVLTAALASSSPTGPVDWSRDGRWLAWTAVESSDAPALAPGWLLSPRNVDGPSPSTPARRTHRIWATRFPSLRSALILESSDPVSSPCWSMDGRSMAYARFIPSETVRMGMQRGRFELVVRSGLDQERSVVIQPALKLDVAARESLPATRPVLSPDGRRVVVPRPGSSGVWLALLDDSEEVMSLEDAVAPAWSPDGRRLAYLRVRTGPAGNSIVSLQITPSGARIDRPLAVEHSLTPDFLAWASDGQSLLLIANPARGPLRSTQMDLVRVGLDGNLLGRPTSLESTPPINGARRLQRPSPVGPEDKPAFLRAELSMDADQEEAVCLVETNGREQVLRWGNIQTQNTFKRFHPLDAGLRIDAPSLSPDGRTAALRVDDGTGAGLLALVDLGTEELSLIAPDEATRRRWLDRLAYCALGHLLEWLPGADAAPVRPTVLPILSELGGLQPRRYTLSRLARFASPLLKKTTDSGPDGLEEFRLFFSYLNQDFDSALQHLDAIDTGSEDDSTSLRFLGLRAQILLGAGQIEKVRGIIDYLAKETRSTTLAVEETAGTYAITTELHPETIWVEHLRERSFDREFQRARPVPGGRLDQARPVEPASNLEGWDQDPMPNVPFAPVPGVDQRVVPILPDELNPPGLRPRDLFTPPAPGGPVPPGLPGGLNRRDALRLEIDE